MEITRIVEKFEKDQKKFKSEKDFLKQVIAKAEERRSLRNYISLIRNESRMSVALFKKDGLLEEVYLLVGKELKKKPWNEIGNATIQKFVRKIKENLEEDKKILEQMKDEQQRKGSKVPADFERRIVLAGQKAHFLSGFSGLSGFKMVMDLRKRIYREKLRRGRETKLDIEESRREIILRKKK